MRVADYIFEQLARQGVRDVFMVTGGGSMHLVDALGCRSDIRFWCNHHEQACAIAAEGYARTTDDIGVCLVTTGPGATNALSGLAGAWYDSVPVLAISGQVRTGLIADYAKHRQIGPQEVDIVSMARPVTKYAKTIMSADEVPAELERALHIARSGRPGPVWLDVPLDVQGAPMPDDRASLEGIGSQAASALLDEPIHGIDEFSGFLRRARRPVVVCGNGVHLAHAERLFEQFVERVGCPVVATVGGMDLLWEDHPLYLGRFGPTGQRRANFTIQNADLLICVGTGMAVAAVGFDTSTFAPGAKRIMVNVDAGELDKPHFKLDCGLLADLRPFFMQFLQQFSASDVHYDERWLPEVMKWKASFPIITDNYFEDDEHVNSYVLANVISKHTGPGEVVLSGNSLDAQSIFHSFAVKPGQRVLTNSNYGAMGWDLPAAIGACLARRGARTVLVTGDGSIEMNVQELLTIGHNGLDVKVFVLNNAGYASIRTTQNTFFEGRHVGSSSESGLGNPRFDALAEAFGLGYRLLETNHDLEAVVPEVLLAEGPCLCEVNVSFLQEREPRIISRRREDGTFESCPLDEQYPFLSKETHEAVMGVFGTRTREV